MSWFLRCSWCGGPFNGGNCRRYTNVSFRDELVRNPDPISYDKTPNFSYPPLQPRTYSCELCGNDSHYGYDCPPRIESRNELLNTMQSLCEMILQREQAVNLSNHTPEPSRRFNSICYDDDDDEESTIPLNEIVSQIPPSIVITPVLPTVDLEHSLIIGDEDLCTIPKKKSNEFIKSSVEDLVPIPRESMDTSDSDKEYIKNKDSYVSNLNEPALLVTPLFDANEDGCFDPGEDIDEIDADISTDIEDGYYDSEGDIIYLNNQGFIGYPVDYRVTLDFGSIGGGIYHVNRVIRLPLEHRISRVPGLDDYSNPSVGTNPTASIT
nr:hypothetical protein [Tanacetum cinerariifolium]